MKYEVVVTTRDDEGKEIDSYCQKVSTLDVAAIIRLVNTRRRIRPSRAAKKGEGA